MNRRPRVAYEGSGPEADNVRLWLLQLGAEPVERAEPAASGLPLVPQREGMGREDVAAFLAGTTGGHPTRAEKFDDHGSAEEWPRGSY